MESLKSILGRAIVPSSSPDSRQKNDNDNSNDNDIDNSIMSNDPRAERYNPPEAVNCEYCGAPRYTKGINLGHRVMWMPYGPERCDCPEAVAAYEKAEAERVAKEEAERKATEAFMLRERIRKIIGESGMGDRFLRRTFETFEITKDNQKAYTMAKKYADSFENLMPKRGQPEPGRNGIFIAGPAGTGKTHIAAAIANQLIHKGRPVICMTMIDLLARIRKTFNRDGTDESAVLSLYKTVPLLIIDDIGKEPPTEWAISTIYNIINGRYEAYLPTIVTTNYDDKALIERMTPKTSGDSVTAEATIDRLMEMCIGVVMTGPSWRQR